MANISAGQKYEIHSILRRVRFGEVVSVNKPYLLALLGRERDRGEAWKELLDFFEDVGGDRDSIYGIDANGSIILSGIPFTAITGWAGE